jgi:hypothetical protein
MRGVQYLPLVPLSTHAAVVNTPSSWPNFQAISASHCRKIAAKGEEMATYGALAGPGA